MRDSSPFKHKADAMARATYTEQVAAILTLASKKRIQNASVTEATILSSAFPFCKSTMR